jgi:RNA polymerase sigma factor (sigma-70 family)
VSDVPISTDVGPTAESVRTHEVDPSRVGFEQFASEKQRPFLDAMVARFGPQLGADAAASAMAYAWEHWDRVGAMERPLAYLFRVAQSSLRPQWRWLLQRSHAFPSEIAGLNSTPDVDLARALTKLPKNQRVAVLLVHAYGWSYREVADLLNVSEAAVTNHVSRGRSRLRVLLNDEGGSNE